MRCKHDLEKLVKVPMVLGLSATPKGDAIAFSWNKTGIYQLYLIDGRGIRQLTNRAGSCIHPAISRNGGLVAYHYDEIGSENYFINILNLKTGEDYTLVEGGKYCNRFAEISPDGKWIAYTSNREGVFHVYKTNIETGETVKLTDSKRHDFQLSWSPDGRKIAVSRFTPNATIEHELILVDSETGEEESLGRFSTSFTKPDWRADGKAILFQSEDSGYYNVIEIDVQTKKYRAIDPAEREQHDPKYSIEGEKVIFTEIGDIGNYIVIKDLRSGERRILKVGSGVHHAIAPVEKGIVAIYSSGRRTPDLWLISWDEKAKQLTNGMPEDINVSELVEPKAVKYKSLDGLEVPALLYEPAGERIAGLVHVHGGPTAQVLNTWSPIIQFIVGCGFVVIAPNFRGSTGYGRKFRELNRMDWGGGDLKDVVAAARYLKEKYGIEKVAVMGGSYGGYMTFLAMTKYPDEWYAGVSIVGIVNLKTLYKGTRGDLKTYLEYFMGKPDENPELYEERSPINYAHQIKAPILIIQGAHDPRVPLEEAFQMAEKLREVKVKYKLVVYGDEGHGLLKMSNRLEAIKMSAEFLLKEAKASK